MRRAVRALTTRRSHQFARGQLLKCVKERSLLPVKDVEIDDAQVAYPKDCAVVGIQCHHGSQLRATVMDRWPSLSRPGSSELPRNHLHLAVVSLALQVTYTRQSDLLKLMKNLVPLLVPWWSAVIAVYETGVFTNTAVRDRSVPIDQSSFRWVYKLFHKLKCGNLAKQIWNLN